MIEREYSRMADMAMFNRAAYHKKRLKKGDLFKPSENVQRMKRNSVKSDKEAWKKFDEDLASGKRKFRKLNANEVNL